MKRLTAILVAGIFVLAPLSASAMEMMSDSNMKDVTGQAGVSIAIDDVVIYQEGIADTTYWDTDGADNFLTDGIGTESGEADTAEYGVEIAYQGNTKKLITLDAIVDGTSGPYNHGELASEFEEGGIAVPEEAGINRGSGPSALTIDVGVAETLTDGVQYKYNNNLDGYDQAPALSSDSQIAGVVIGLPTVEIRQFHTADRRTITLRTDSGGADDNVVNAGQSFIDIEQSGTSKMAILGGTLEIAPH